MSAYDKFWNDTFGDILGIVFAIIVLVVIFRIIIHFLGFIYDLTPAGKRREDKRKKEEIERKAKQERQEWLEKKLKKGHWLIVINEIQKLSAP